MKEESEFIAWVTSYALTSGIKRIRAKQSPNFPSMISDADNSMATYHGEGRDWHRTPEDALQRAEDMRIAKIASLSKSLKKMREMQITCPRNPEN